MSYFTIKEIPGVYFPWYGRPQIDDWLKLKQFVYQRDEGICRYCYQPVPYEESHCHHVLEISEHGTNHPSNLKTLCRDCHKARHPFMRNARDKLRQGTDKERNGVA